MLEHGTSGAEKKLIEQGPVIVKKGPKQVRHSEGDMLPFTIWQNMALLCDPLFGAFETTCTAGFRFTGLTKETGMSAFRRLPLSSGI